MNSQIEAFENTPLPGLGKKALIVLSGGQDSTTCLFIAKAMGYELHAVTFDYNQRHSIEIESAKRVARMADVKSHEIVYMGPILKGTSPLVSGNELEQYSDHAHLPGGLEKTFVPMRNQLFLTIAANRAYVLGCACLFTGVCEEDFGGYPDCRQVFIDAFTDACNTGTFTGENGANEPIEVFTPLMKLTKAESVDLAVNTAGAYRALAWSHTSYDGHFPPVGKDHATLLRAKGFEQAGVPDPLLIRAWCLDMTELPNTPNYSAELVSWAIAFLSLSEEELNA
jgi:7-cyano-7-deazaguanine synthase